MGYFLDKLAEEIEVKLPDHIPNSDAVNYALTGAGVAGVGYHGMGAMNLHDAAKVLKGSKDLPKGLLTRAHIVNAARGLAAGGLAAYGLKRLYDNHKSKDTSK